MSTSTVEVNIATHGRFDPPEPSLVWLTVDQGADRLMKLDAPFAFHDVKASKVWRVEAGYRVDGATIPRALWTVVGSPYTGDYRRASIVHDKACDGANAPQRRDADKMFYRACRAGGCSVREATLLYIGVRIGAWFGSHALWRKRIDEEGDTVRVTRTPLEQRIEADFGLVADQVLAAGETDDADAVEQRTDGAMVAWMGSLG